VHIICTFEPKVITTLGKPKKNKRYKILCISTTTVKRRYCCVSLAKMVCERTTILRYTYTVHVVVFPSDDAGNAYYTFCTLGIQHNKSVCNRTKLWHSIRLTTTQIIFLTSYKMLQRSLSNVRGEKYLCIIR
jgi:hypothetical protein